MINNRIFVLLSNLLFWLKVRADISEFGLHELDEYNEMIKCLSSFRDDFVECNRNIRSLGRTVFQVFPENSTVGKAFKCCGIWMVRDCWYKKAEENCPKNQLHLIHKMPNRLLPSLHKWCDDYRDDSFVCRLPQFWPIFLILFALLIIISIIACILCFIRSRRRTKSKDLECQSTDNKSIKSDNNNAIDSDSDV